MHVSKIQYKCIYVYTNNNKLAVDRDEGDKKLVFCQWSQI